MSTVTTARGTAGSRGRHRATVLVTLGVLVVLLAVALLTQDRAESDGALDPRNPDDNGAQALERVLSTHGIAVRIVRGQDALLDSDVDASTGIVVTNADDLGTSTLDRLRSFASDADSVVLVGDGPLLGDLLDLDTMDSEDPAGADVSAGCDDDLVRGLVLRTYASTFLKAEGCFGDDDDAALLLRRDAFRYFASPESLANEHVLARDNAAVALRLLGQQPRLLWYVADPSDLDGSDGVGLASLLPPWLLPSSILLLGAVLATMLLRGRRLGPLVTEPIPVVVRAVESTRSRGRAYRRARDRSHAATILTSATRERLAVQLGLPTRTRADVVAHAAAGRTGHDPRELHALLTTTTVPDDARLAELGRHLLQLENEVRTP